MLINLTNAVSKDPILYSSNFFLNSNQGLALFRQKQIFRPNRHKNLQKQNNEDFFMLGYISLIATSLPAPLKWKVLINPYF